MSTPYVGEIKIFAGNFAPNGWLFCEGQLLPISEYEVLFQLIGTTYGGDGEETFQLPDLRGRLPVHMGSGGGGSYTIGEVGGQEEITLSLNQIPSHTHPLLANAQPAESSKPSGKHLAETDDDLYADPPTTSSMGAAVGFTGGTQPHSNFHPYLCLNFIISLFGIFPSPN